MKTDSHVEHYQLSRRFRRVGLSEGSPSVFVQAEDQQSCLRVLKNGHCGLVTHPHINDENRNELIRQAEQLSSYSFPDSTRQFASPPVSLPTPIPWDSALFNRTPEEIMDMLEGVERTILGFNKRITKVLRLDLSEELSIKSIQNSLGLNVSTSSTSVSVLGEIIASDGITTESAWDVSHARFFRDLELHSWAQGLAEDAVQCLGAGPVPSGDYAVLVHPKVGVQLLSLFAQALSAEAIQMGRSFLRHQVGQVVASPAVILKDDPFLLSGVASDTIDDEGSLHHPLTVVDQGVLLNCFYDLRSAAQEGISSNGHGLKESVGSHPIPQATNFYMAGGSQTLNQLMTAHGVIFLLKEVMGLHMADPVTGEFSLGASGVLIRNGKVEQSVRGVTIAGSMSRFLTGVEAVGAEVYWRGSFGSPYFLVSSLTVAGS